MKANASDDAEPATLPVFTISCGAILFSVLGCHQTQIYCLFPPDFSWYKIITAPLFCLRIIIPNVRTHRNRKSSYWEPSHGARPCYYTARHKAESVYTNTWWPQRYESSNGRPSILRVCGREKLLESSLSRGRAADSSTCISKGAFS